MSLCVLLGCSSRYSYFLTSAGTQKATLQELFTLIEEHSAASDAEARFVVNNQIIDIFTNTEDHYKKIHFLLAVVSAYPTDSYNAYYLAIVAQTYQQMGAHMFAVYYYNRVVKNHPDLLFREEYIHKYCLEQLALLSNKPQEKLFAYTELLNRFYDVHSEKRAEALFQLARTYEAISQWDSAKNTYQDFLAAPKTPIPGFPDAYKQVQEKLSLYETPPDWVVDDLNVLVSRIRRAIVEDDVATLNKYRAKGYFFTVTWEQKQTNETGYWSALNVADYLGSFLARSDVKVAEKLDIDSSAKEAYLRTEKWQFKIHSTWYFYFRKVDFGPDPDINGGWEWVGICFGEKL